VKRALRASWALPPGAEVVSAVSGPGEDGEGERGRPERAEVEEVDPARRAAKRLSPAQDEGRNGETGTGGWRRRPSRREGLHAQQPLGADEAEEDDDRDREEEAHRASARRGPRRAGKTLTRARVTTAPRAVG